MQRIHESGAAAPFKVSLPPAHRDAFDLAAKRLGMSRNALLRRLIERARLLDALPSAYNPVQIPQTKVSP
jgi:hypothetical protein